MAYAAGLGGARALLIETDFKEETETDLFGEQAVLCGGASELVLKGFETLVEAGYKPEIAYYEVLHELKLIVDLLYQGGITKMLAYVSETAQYGDYTRGPRVVDDATKERMKAILREIQDGTFAREWTAEYAAGLPNYKAYKRKDQEHPIERVERAAAPEDDLAQQLTTARPATLPTPGRACGAWPTNEEPEHERPTASPARRHRPAPARGRPAQRRGDRRRCWPTRRGCDLRLPGGAILPVYDAVFRHNAEHRGTDGSEPLPLIVPANEQGAASWPRATRAPPARWAWPWSPAAPAPPTR